MEHNQSHYECSTICDLAVTAWLGSPSVAWRHLCNVGCSLALPRRSSVADDRIALTNRASPQDDFGAARGPIRLDLVRRDAKWDKQNRSASGLCPPALTCQDRSRKRSPFLLKQKSNWKRIQLVGYGYLGCDSKNWLVIIGNPETTTPAETP